MYHIHILLVISLPVLSVDLVVKSGSGYNSPETVKGATTVDAAKVDSLVY
ncbi:MAG: hypothetical protein GY694_01195 [Gammaproteobacteria bacterium]|nr:hypothetical protein [Gammaproteobacteria bacterium]